MKNRPPRFYRIVVFASDSGVLQFVTALEDFAETVSWFEAGEGLWRIEALMRKRPERARIGKALAWTADYIGIATPALTIEPLPEADWLADNRRAFPPVSAGRFFVHGTGWEGTPPPGRMVLRLDAGEAFGSGSHETTRGCLLALDRLARRRRFFRLLDLGCGSGILSLAIAALWRCPVLAVDVDPAAVRVAQENARQNALAPLVRVVRGDGFRHAAVRRRAPYDLIVANILAEPLRHMAADLVRALAPGGVAVLSGLLAAQERAVLEACRRHGVILTARLRLGDWVTLTAERKQRPSFRGGPDSGGAQASGQGRGAISRGDGCPPLPARAGCRSRHRVGHRRLSPGCRRG